jgi:hypothetical protein
MFVLRFYGFTVLFDFLLFLGRYLGLQHLIQMKGMSDTDVSREEIILRVASEDPSAISSLNHSPSSSFLPSSSSF